jgi:O-antigen/teichoic acid export membrane protein
VRDSLGISGLFAVPLFFGSLVVAHPLVGQVYGDGYAEAATFLSVLALYRVLESQARVLETTVDGLDRPRETFHIASATLAFNIVLGLLLLVVIGPVGVAVATVVSEAIRYVALRVRVRQAGVEGSLVPPLLRRQVESALVMFGSLLAVGTVFPPTTGVRLAVTLGLGGAVYGGWLVTRSTEIRGVARQAIAPLGR